MMRVGIVGAGQLARMMAEAASALGLEIVLLAEGPHDGAISSVQQVRFGSPKDADALRCLADEVDVVTFDHEHVSLETLSELESEGHRVFPSPSSLVFAVDKGAMRDLCQRHAFPHPRFRHVPLEETVNVEEVGRELGWPFIIKTTRGGYDGKGVFVAHNAVDATRLVDELRSQGSELLIEEAVAFDRELAVLVARRPQGDIVAWPAVETAQLDGVCREVLLPGSLAPAVVQEAEALARAVAEAIDLTGVMAVELFERDGQLLMNELALRPHNSGHWTQDGAETSQFENHLRAILDLPLGRTSMTAPAVASVNVFGGPDGSPALLDCLGNALATPGAHVHLYGKETRPMRKLGHVTVTDKDVHQARRAAWAAASALGTPVPSEVEEQHT